MMLASTTLESCHNPRQLLLLLLLIAHERASERASSHFEAHRTNSSTNVGARHTPLAHPHQSPPTPLLSWWKNKMLRRKQRQRQTHTRGGQTHTHTEDEKQVGLIVCSFVPWWISPRAVKSSSLGTLRNPCRGKNHHHVTSNPPSRWNCSPNLLLCCLRVCSDNVSLTYSPSFPFSLLPSLSLSLVFSSSLSLLLLPEGVSECVYCEVWRNLASDWGMILVS